MGVAGPIFEPHPPNFKDQYSYVSNNRGGWNKRVGVQKLQNQLDFFSQFLS